MKTMLLSLLIGSMAFAAKDKASQLTHLKQRAPANSSYKVHACESHAVKRAESFIKFYIAESITDETFLSENLAVDNKVAVKGKVSAFVGKGKYDVLEVNASIYKALYKMNFYYTQINNECILMGQEIKEMSDLSAINQGNESVPPKNTEEISLQCAPPKMLAGGNVANVSGKLTLAPAGNGAFNGTGKLKISLIKSNKIVWSGEKTTSGRYDDLTSNKGDRYFNGASEDLSAKGGAAMVYVNFTRPQLSSVEYDGIEYKMECK